jgi:hypothetical protein
MILVKLLAMSNLEEVALKDMEIWKVDDKRWKIGEFLIDMVNLVKEGAISGLSFVNIHALYLRMFGQFDVLENVTFGLTFRMLRTVKRVNRNFWPCSRKRRI